MVFIQVDEDEPGDGDVASAPAEEGAPAEQQVTRTEQRMQK